MRESALPMTESNMEGGWFADPTVPVLTKERH